MRRGLGVLVLAALVAASSACGKELMAGGQRGEVTTTMSDGPDGTAARSDRVPSSHALRTVLPAGTGPQGTVEAEVRVALVDGSGRVDVIAPGGAATVRIGDAAGAVLGTDDSVSVGLYPTARVTFSSVTADVTGGLLGVGGLPVLGRVSVQLTAPVTIDVPVALAVEADSEHRVVVDLNASAWLAAVDPVTLTVPASAFRGALAVRAE